MDFFEVVLLAKKEAKTVGRPVDSQLLKYLIVRFTGNAQQILEGAKSMANRYLYI